MKNFELINELLKYPAGNEVTVTIRKNTNNGDTQWGNKIEEIQHCGGGCPIQIRTTARFVP